AAATVLSGKGHENTIYELSGKSLTQEEFVSVLGSVLDKEVSLQHVDDATYAGIMKNADIPDFVISILVDIQKSIRESTLDFESNDFEKVLGRPATPLKEALSQIVNGITQKK
ncbi:SDR family NAD(P)-dependent oxidoreductase, partial [Solibacillus silvestris]